MRWALSITCLILLGCKSTAVDRRPVSVQRLSFAQPLLAVVAPPMVTTVTEAHFMWVDDDPGAVAFNLYYGFFSPHEYDYVVPNISSQDCVVSNLMPGTTYYVAVTAVDTNGVESDYSPQYVFAMPLTLEFGFAFDRSVTNVSVQSSVDLMTWKESQARPRTNGLWRVDVDGQVAQEFYRGIGQAVPAP